jgi:GxxExxY protein
MPFEDNTFEIIGCAIRVHRALGPGLRKEPYANALKLDLEQNGFHPEPQRAFPIRYLDHIVGDCTPDLTVDDEILIEVESIDSIGEDEIAHMLNDLRIAQREVGLIVNFKNFKIETKRVMRNQRD